MQLTYKHGHQHPLTLQAHREADILQAIFVHVLQVYGLRPFRIPLRWDFMNRTSPSEQLYNGVT